VNLELAALAGLYGVVAASGLMIGAVVGLVAKPTQRIVSVVMAFGSGTLLSALAFDLCVNAYQRGGPYILVFGFLTGGIVFVLAESLVDEQGGFLRREGTRARFLQQKKEERDQEILGRLAEVELFRALPPTEAHAVVPYVEERRFRAGDTVFEQGDTGDALYLITEGEAQVLDRDRELARLAKGAAFGEMALLTGEPRNATVRAASDLSAYRIAHQDFEHLLSHSPQLSAAVQHLLAERVQARQHLGHETTADTWRKAASAHLSRQLSVREEKAIIEAHSGASVPLAIFVGALVDGIPESVVIGASLVSATTPSLSLLLAVFLSNFPEAMSSASGMTRAGFTPMRVIKMWGLLVVLAGISAALGNAFLSGASPDVLAFAESLAAGGILALLANTMMPEAFELGGRATAFGTIAGFLAAFLVAMMH
jgi:CRP-like cAMP-binding protein